MTGSLEGIGRGLGMVLGAGVALAAAFFGAIFLILAAFYLLEYGSFVGFGINLGLAIVCFAIPVGLRWLGRR